MQCYIYIWFLDHSNTYVRMYHNLQKSLGNTTNNVATLHIWWLNVVVYNGDTLLFYSIYPAAAISTFTYIQLQRIYTLCNVCLPSTSQYVYTHLNFQDTNSLRLMKDLDWHQKEMTYYYFVNTPSPKYVSRFVEGKIN